MRQISSVMIAVEPVFFLTTFDWLNISGNYFSNDFSFSLLSSCRFSRRAWVTFLLLWMCPRRREEGRRPPESFLHVEWRERGEKWSSFYSIFDVIFSRFLGTYRTWIIVIDVGFFLYALPKTWFVLTFAIHGLLIKTAALFSSFAINSLHILLKMYF